MSQKFQSEIQLNALNNATTDTDKFLVSDSGIIKYRTGAEVLSDIGGQTALTDPITGTGTTNYVPKFTGTSAIGNSNVYDDGTNVGIGTSSPGFPLEVNGAIVSKGGGTGGLDGTIGFGATGTSLSGNALLGEMYFKTGGSEKMRINISGNVGIGTTSPTAKLHISDTNKVFDNYGNVNIFTSNTASADIGGSIAFGGTNSSGGTSPYVFAKIQGIKEGSASSYNGALILGTTASSSAVTERMRITSAGNVGIGTTSPTVKLHLVASSENEVRVQESTNNAFISLYQQAATSYLIAGRTGATPSQPLAIYTGGSERMRITSTGNVGIGTTSPSALLHLVPSSDDNAMRVSRNNGYVSFYDSTGVTRTGYIQFNSNTDSRINVEIAQPLTFYTSASERMRIAAAGNVGIGTTSPTYKTHIEGTGADIFLTKNTSSTSFNRSYFYNNNNIGIQFLNFGSAYAFGTEFSVGVNGSVIQSNTTSAFAVGTSGAYPLILGTSGAERMRILSGGNVGIGTTNPSEKLAVSGNIELTTGANRYIKIGSASNYYYNLQSVGDDFQILEAGATPRLTIKYPGGKVGIGTSSPSSKLTVDDSTAFSWGFPSVASAKIGTPGTGGSFLVMTPSLNSSYESGFAVDGTYSGGKSVINLSAFGVYSGGPYSADIAFKTATNTTLSEKMRITNEGNIGIGTTSPTYRTEIVRTGSGIQNLLSLKNLNQSVGVIDGVRLNLRDFNIESSSTYGSSDNILTIGISTSKQIALLQNGNVGIGTTSPSQKLDVAGDALINGLTVGTGPGNDTSNTVLGENAFGSNSSAIRNVAIGSSALSSLTINGKNVAIGFGALGSTQETDYSIAIGNRCADSVSGNVRGLTAIGSDMSYDPSQATELGNNCLAISQYDNTTPGLPHFYAPAKIVCPNGNTVTDVLSFDYTLYTAVFMDYSIYNDGGDQFRAGTFTVAMKLTGTDVTNDDQTVVYSGTTLSATFIVSISGNIATIQIRNQDSDNYNFRFTSRLLMR